MLMGTRRFSVSQKETNMLQLLQKNYIYFFIDNKKSINFFLWGQSDTGTAQTKKKRTWTFAEGYAAASGNDAAAV